MAEPVKTPPAVAPPSSPPVNAPPPAAVAVLAASGEHRDREGRLTRAGMEHVIRGGGSVAYKGRVLARLADLPDATELAGQDAGALDAAEADLDRREQSLAAERARLAAARGKGGKR